ncbi:hypothetical protein ACFV6F_03390 [Kitasatospora phosalacinea]|uniref:hypothetical protein n=1 Tax=Kitasatospora phosalacinea TaxID=2065 RepID=UPI003657DA5D
MNGEQEIRALIGSWLADEDVADPPPQEGTPPPARDGGALPVRDSGAREVAEAARRLALRGLAGERASEQQGAPGQPGQPGPAESAESAGPLGGLPDGLPEVPDALYRIARGLVVDEHPSAWRWTRAERNEVARWVALLMHRFGEDGVQELVAEFPPR